ncbi:MAG: polysaccharide lyase 8 family protein [Cetobacterium sp.]|nr:polysaccharide lyase 8 family protein [Cetobacterium sp.]
MKRVLSMIQIIGIFIFISSFTYSNSRNDYEKIRKNWKEYLIGTNSLETLSREEKKDIINTYEKNGSNYIKTLEINRNNLWSDLIELDNPVVVNEIYKRIGAMTKVYSYPGTIYYKNKDLLKKIEYSLEWSYKNIYNENKIENGNWWQWEIGIPKQLNEILGLLYEDISKEKINKYLKASIYFQPDPYYSGKGPGAIYSTSPTKRLTTGGNRIDTGIISIVRGALLEDQNEIKIGADSVSDVGEYVTSGDGFYKDGSFIQHGTIPYTGTYGNVLLNGLGQVMYLLDGTKFEIKNPKIDNIYESIMNGVNPLIYRGRVLDMVNGRSISRDQDTDLKKGIALLNSIGFLSVTAPIKYKEKLEEIVIRNYTEIYGKNYSLSHIKNPLLRKNMKNILEKNTIKIKKINESIIYNNMNRVVHRQNDFLFGISMHSNRVGNFETMNGENKQGWYTGDGMTYLYTNNLKEYKDYWPTVDMYHLPGTTVSQTLRENFSGERRIIGKMAPLAWVGGISIGNISLIGMDYISWNNLTKAKKSWFLFEDSIVGMGSNIYSKDGEVHTTLENKIIENYSISDMKNNKELFLKNDEINLRYKILDNNKGILKKEKRVGSYKKIGGKSDSKIEKDYITYYINHGKNPENESYLYSIVINKNTNTKIEILSQNNKAHGIKYNNYKFINFWTDLKIKVDNYTSNSTLSLIAKENKDILEMWFYEPTRLNKKIIEIEIMGNYEMVKGDKSIKIKRTKNKTIIYEKNSNKEKSYIKLKKI